MTVQAKREGKRQLKAAVAQHRSWDPCGPDVLRMRFADDVDPSLGLTMSQVGRRPCAPPDTCHDLCAALLDAAVITQCCTYILLCVAKQ